MDNHKGVNEYLSPMNFWKTVQSKKFKTKQKKIKKNSKLISLFFKEFFVGHPLPIEIFIFDTPA